MTALPKPSMVELARALPSCLGLILRPKMVMPDHMIDIDNLLARTFYGTLKRLTITLPRRHSKTYLTSELYPLWFLGVSYLAGRAVEIAVVSYSQEKANDISRAMRGFFDHPIMAEVFPGLTLQDGNESVGQWSTSNGSRVYALGVGGSMTGRGAHLMIIDDSIKNEEEALSSTHRAKLWDRYLTVLVSSLYETGVIVHVGTRWRSDDLIGRVKSHEPEVWHSIHKPALLDEHTERERPLWPYDPESGLGYSLDHLRRMRSLLGHRWWQTQYQGNPIDSAEGTLGTPVISDKPQGALSPRVVCYVDPAYDGKDSTAYVIGTRSGDGLYILYADCKRANAIQMAGAISNSCLKYSARSIYIETNADKGWLAKEMRGLGHHVIPIVESRNKIGRIESRVGQNFKKIIHAPGCDPEYIEQLSAWSEIATHDDAADALAGLWGVLIDKTQGATVIPARYFGG